MHTTDTPSPAPEHPAASASPVDSAPGRALLTLLGKFRAEAQRRGSHGRDFILSCLETVAEKWRALVQRCSRRADEVAEEITELEQRFEEVIADGIVTPEERARFHAAALRPKQHACTLAQTLRESL